MTQKGIDVSHWQGDIDFNRVINAGYTFVIIKAGGWTASGYKKDVRFEEYYSAAVAAGMSVGAYFYTSPQFTTREQGEYEAQLFCEYIAGKKFDFPVYCDVEEVATVTKAGNTQATIGFCEYMENKGYYVGIYASDVSGFAERLSVEQLTAYDKWVARYSSNPPSYVTDYGVWQYGGSVNYLNTVSVDGVSSVACDQDYAYKNYPSIIKNARLNGFTGKVKYEIEFSEAISSATLDEIFTKVVCAGGTYKEV